MVILIVQLVVIAILAAALLALYVYFPYPSPWIRRWLPARKRWPEAQVRGWLERGRFQAAFLRYFYRDPERFPASKEGMLAPADGVIMSAEVRGAMRYLVIALSFWDMHVQRSPLPGRVVRVESLGGTFMDWEWQDFAFLRDKPCPVQKRMVMETPAGQLAVRFITSLAARRIETWVDAGDAIERGQRIGRILLGSTVVFELPATAKMQVSVGERVRAGETVVAAWQPIP
ncbi:MAG TPA: phosphatidylserine decarboxylase [Rhodanobacteraceae bacterium]